MASCELPSCPALGTFRVQLQRPATVDVTLVLVCANAYGNGTSVVLVSADTLFLTLPGPVLNLTLIYSVPPMARMR